MSRRFNVAGGEVVRVVLELSRQMRGEDGDGRRVCGVRRDGEGGGVEEVIEMKLIARILRRCNRVS